MPGCVRGLRLDSREHASVTKTSHCGVSIQVQSILYHVDEASIGRALESLARAIELAVRDGHCTEVRVSYGDTSAQRCLSEATLERFVAEFSGTFDLSYCF